MLLLIFAFCQFTHKNIVCGGYNGEKMGSRSTETGNGNAERRTNIFMSDKSIPDKSDSNREPPMLAYVSKFTLSLTLSSYAMLHGIYWFCSRKKICRLWTGLSIESVFGFAELWICLDKMGGFFMEDNWDERWNSGIMLYHHIMRSMHSNENIRRCN